MLYCYEGEFVMDRLIEMILSIGMWCVQIGAVVMAGLGVWYVLYFLSGKRLKNMYKWIVMLLVFLLAAGIAACPPLVGSPDLEVPVKEMSEGLRKDCRAYSCGLYSLRLPLLPIYIEVLECDGTDALTRTHYFPFGTVERLTGPDGPSITKPLN